MLAHAHRRRRHHGHVRVTGEPAIVEQCRGFLDAIVGETEDRGWQCWLMRIVADGIMAMCANRTLDGLPMALRVRRRKALRKTLRSRRPYRSDDGRKCYEDHMAYARQNQWLCATTLLRWGTPGQTTVRAARQFMMCHESALMLIDDGECFTHGETVCIDGTDAGHGTAAPGTSSIDDYLQRLRSQADAAYRASTRRQQIAQELHTSRGMQPSDSDVRYVYAAVACNRPTPMYGTCTTPNGSSTPTSACSTTTCPPTRSS